jgi:hypothetical protein
MNCFCYLYYVVMSLVYSYSVEINVTSNTTSTQRPYEGPCEEPTTKQGKPVNTTKRAHYDAFSIFSFKLEKVLFEFASPNEIELS